MRAVLTSPARDPYNMITKMGMPGFWGVKNNNVSDLETHEQMNIAADELAEKYYEEGPPSTTVARLQSFCGADV